MYIHYRSKVWGHLPSGLWLIGHSFILQQDNDPKHTLKLCKNYLVKEECEQQLKLKTWPAQCPDLNPIELVWDKLERKSQSKATHKFLWELLQDSWENMSGLSHEQNMAEMRLLMFMGMAVELKDTSIPCNKSCRSAQTMWRLSSLMPFKPKWFTAKLTRHSASCCES
ncbi:hypothetical protein AAFF_G00382730 [Aldrovandia affinis]|uniref:Tc1-like transposase DDE domain-containing protein n=1 Tax=Aldrovandia affinis TaxID=143900 RepID=A0AAD7T8C3_9TELE|nr:hypothetical protein AAFF_G00382730 [Aldrovandia affinis]